MSDEEKTQLVWTTPDPQYRGIVEAKYKGHTIQIKPVGSAEYDFIIDGKLRFAGTDDFEATEAMAMLQIDNPGEQLKHGVVVTSI